jgi:spore maturation protein CgeB
MKIAIFGLAITSSWGNGHATTFRALSSALRKRGHDIVFFEKEAEWYASNRDMPEPPYCKVINYETWAEVLPRVRRELRDSDVALIGSYFPDGIEAIRTVIDSDVAVKAFYDIDTPITLSQLRESGRTNYLLAEQIPELDLYFSFTGGPALSELEQSFHAKRAVPLYCSVDPEKYTSLPSNPEFDCDLSYMGTYAPDRQPKIDALLCAPARRLPNNRFIVAGPQYPDEIRWPQNVNRIVHLEPKFHSVLYSSSRMTLNVTRRDMVMTGYSPSVRLFEAAACGATIASDNWPGLDEFFVPGKEILLPTGTEDVVRYISGMDESELRAIGFAAQARVLAEHSSSQRALEFENEVLRVSSNPESGVNSLR